MWRFYLLRFERGCAPVGAIMLALCAGLACPARAADEEIARTAQADHSVVIREHAGWNMECEAIAHPALYLNEPPRHGSICARLQDIKIRSIFAGTEAQCIGRVVSGVQLIYRPDAGFVGDDRLRYAAQYPSVLRPVAVLVKVASFPPATPHASPSGLSVPVPPARQAPGQVPPCEDLVF
jgi:hypothetical protein